MHEKCHLMNLCHYELANSPKASYSGCYAIGP